MCQERHEKGVEEYGYLTWIENDTVGMLLEELVDAANYARFTFVRILLLAEAAKLDINLGGKGHDLPIGPTAFTPTSQPKED